MITTTEIVLIVMLTIGVGVAIWWFVVAEKYKSYLGKYSYTRGANATNGNKIEFSCGGGKKICLYRATQICTRPGANNFETSSLEPIASGDSSLDEGANVMYGDFNPQTTIDLTKEIGNLVNGKNKAEYTFNAPTGWKAPNGVACNGNSQLIATYACIPEGGDCSSWSPLKD